MPKEGVPRIAPKVAPNSQFCGRVKADRQWSPYVYVNTVPEGMTVQILLILLVAFIAARLHFLVKEVEKTNELLALQIEETRQGDA